MNAAFPNYTEISSAVPTWLWFLLRLTVLGATFLVVYALFATPAVGLSLFWKIVVPLLPLCFAIAPGLWRNVCPMAFLNQLPRLSGTGMQLTLSKQGRNLALLTSILLFVLLVGLRRPLLNLDGLATGLMVVTALIAALIGGWLFKGRSGWCGTFCPLAPIQKVYGHAPLIMIRNGYCEPCVGCQKNCYDFNPRAAIYSDVEDSDAAWSTRRKYFAGLLPGLILGFFNAPLLLNAGVPGYWLSFLVPPLLSLGIFATLEMIIRARPYYLVGLFGMVALAIFYWYATPVIASGIAELTGITFPDTAVLLIQIVAIATALVIMVRGTLYERAYRDADSSSAVATVGKGVQILKAATQSAGSAIQVRERSSEKAFGVKPGQSLLDAIEAAELPLMSGCRMGMCGSDPITVTEGADQLPPPDENELTTLRRLGLGGRSRLACCCKPTGNLEIELVGEAGVPTQAQAVSDRTSTSKERTKVVIIGNGVAGISTAEHLRAATDECDITLISEEPHHFYNRMGLEKVVHGHSALHGLYLMQDNWYEKNAVDVWLNTRVLMVSRPDKTIALGTGEVLNYDKLVLATGATAVIPDIDGAHKPGCFVLRNAADAVSIRAWVQERGCKTATVLGGGVLGVEAADALRHLGLRVTIVHGSDRLMNRQLDDEGSAILGQFLNNGGIQVVTGCGITAISGDDSVEEVILTDGRQLRTDLLLFCIGIRPNTKLASTMGLEVNRGVLVDSHLRTGDPDVYCVGDAAELPGTVGGLWSVGNAHGKTVAANLAGDDRRYSADELTPVQLKVSGIDLRSFGDVSSGDATHRFTAGDVSAARWKSLYAVDGRVVGGVFINEMQTANQAITILKRNNRLDETAVKELLHVDT